MGEIKNTEGTASGLSDFESSSDISYNTDINLIPEDDRKYIANMQKILATPIAEKMTPADYYPAEAKDIQVGTYSNPVLGRIPIFAGEALIPQGVIDARKLAQQEYLKQQQKDEELALGAIKIANLKDKVSNAIFMEGQKQDLDNYFTENYEKYRKVYGSPTAARTALFKDYKYRSLQYQNYADAFNETFDNAVAISIDPEAAYNYDEDTRNLAAKFLAGNLDFKPEKIGQLQQFQNELNKRKNLREYAEEVGDLVNSRAMVTTIAQNIINKGGIDEKRITSPDYDIFEILTEPDTKFLKGIMTDAVNEYKERLGGKVSTADETSLNNYLKLKLVEPIKRELKLQLKENLYAWKYKADYAKKLEKQKEAVTPQKNVIDPVTHQQVNQWSLPQGVVNSSLDTETTGDVIITFADGTQQVKKGVTIPKGIDYSVLTVQSGEKNGLRGRDAYIASTKINELIISDPTILGTNKAVANVKAKVPYKNVQSSVVSSGIPLIEGEFFQEPTDIEASKAKTSAKIITLSDARAANPGISDADLKKRYSKFGYTVK